MDTFSDISGATGVLQHPALIIEGKCEQLMNNAPNKELNENDQCFPLRPSLNHVCSRTYYQYAKRHVSIFESFFFIVQLVTHQDRACLIAAQALAQGGTEKDIQRLKFFEENPNPAFSRLRKFNELNSEMMCIATVNNFLTYLSHIIQSCMHAKPELLRSKETVKIDEIMQFTEYDKLISYLVDRKINEISYGGLKEIASFCKDRLAVRIFPSDEEETLISIGIELRNIYTHNRGIINGIMLKRLESRSHDFSFQNGERYHLEFDQLVQIANAIFSASQRLDVVISEKFSVETRTYEEWLAWSHRS